MKRRRIYCTTLLVLIIITSCSVHKTPTAEFINSRYYNLLPQGKSKFSVNITFKEMQEPLKQIINTLYEKGDSMLAKQFSDFHVILMYDKTIDSVTICLSPLDIDESSSLFEGSQNIKNGYINMASGAFMQYRSALIDGFLSENQSENKIITEKNKTNVYVLKNDGQEKYIFSNDYREITMSGLLDNQKTAGIIKATAVGDKLAFVYQEFTFQSGKSIINIFYSQEENTILPSEIAIKNEIFPITVEMTLVFTDWKFE